MPVRTDRCPHCLAALAHNVGPACPHCRRSLLPTGRKARKAAEQELLARAQRAQNAAPQSAHPHQPHPPAFLTDAPHAPTAPRQPAPAAESPPQSAASYAAPAADSAPPGWATPTPLPPIPPPGAGTALPPPGVPGLAPAWGSGVPVPPPPATAGRRKPVLMVVLAIAGIVGSVGGQYVVRKAIDSIGTTVSHETLAGAVESEPPIYDGPSFSVRLPAPVKVDTIEEGGVALTMHGHETGDGIVAVGVVNIPPDSAVDLQAAAEGVALNVGGRIVSQTSTEVAGRPASDIVISGVEGPELGTGWIRIIVDDTRLYEIMALQAGEHTEPPAAYRMAVDSFLMR